MTHSITHGHFADPCFPSRLFFQKFLFFWTFDSYRKCLAILKQYSGSDTYISQLCTVKKQYLEARQ